MQIYLLLKPMDSISDNTYQSAVMRVIEVIQPGVDAEVCWVASDGKSDSICRWAQSSSYVPQHLMIELSG